MIRTLSPTTTKPSTTTGNDRTGHVHAALAAFKADQECLKPIQHRLIRREGLSAERAEAAQEEFLKFKAIYAVEGAPLSPSTLADVFWHSFILDTKRYGDWCLRHFGRFVHHVPNDHAEVLGDRWVVHRSNQLMERYFAACVGDTAAICQSDVACSPAG